MDLECNCDHEPRRKLLPHPSSGRRNGSNAPRKCHSGLLALPSGRGRALAKGMRLWRSINKTHLETLSEERFRRKQHEPPEVVGEGDAAVEFAPQDPVYHEPYREFRMRFGEVVVQLRLRGGGRYR